MECGVQNTNEISDPLKSSNSFMFSEERISKQLIDMKEQTDFMKRFRCALGIALREIKTLRTATEYEHDSEEPAVCQTTPSCQLPKGAHRLRENPVECPSDEGRLSDGAHDSQCVCDDFANSDLRILKKYLNEIDETNNSDSFTPKLSKQMEKTRQDSKTLIERSIAHIERLKGRVENRNAFIKRLCQQLSLARLIRVRRETKLEEKLLEISALKAENTKMRRSYDKQIIIARSLRAALNSQKQKMQSSESMVQRLEETRKAFDSLKSQASHLMKSLHDKDIEIVELTSKLTEKEQTQSENLSQDRADMDTKITDKSNSLVVQIGQRTDTTTCANCERRTTEFESMKINYHRLYDDFEYYRRNHPHYLAPESTQTSRDYDQNHPYNRRRMHAPYASPESYRRVSRPPLRRRLNYGSQYSNEKNGNMGDTLLSPIDEFVENPEDTGQEAATMGGAVDVTMPVSSTNQYAAMQSRNEQAHDIAGDFNQTLQNDTTVKFKFVDASQYHQSTSNSALQRCEPRMVAISEAITSQKDSVVASANTSYLELGNSMPPSRSTSSKFRIEAEPVPPEPPLRMNSCIRQEEPPGDIETANTYPSDDIVDLPQPTPSPEPFNHSFGVIWHPALKEGKKASSLTTEATAREELRLEKLDIALNPTRIQLFGSDSNDNIDSVDAEELRGKSRSHYVTYKGHKIDVTNFSIHEFRDIIWSLDGGQESANAFIKFLASTAKKLNASPKWAGKHTMGNPDDWLALKGLY